jgi:hypothetical protein
MVPNGERFRQTQCVLNDTLGCSLQSEVGKRFACSRKAHLLNYIYDNGATTVRAYEKSLNTTVLKLDLSFQ